MIAPNRRALLPSSRACSPVYLTSRVWPRAPRESRRPPAKTARIVIAADSTSTSNLPEEQHQGPTCSSTRTLLVAVDESAASKRAVIFAVDHLYRPGGAFEEARAIIPVVF